MLEYQGVGYLYQDHRQICPCTYTMLVFFSAEVEIQFGVLESLYLRSEAVAPLLRQVEQGCPFRLVMPNGRKYDISICPGSSLVEQAEGRVRFNFEIKDWQGNLEYSFAEVIELQEA